MIKDKCERCYEVYERITTDEELYKYEDKLYCWGCLEQKLNDDDILSSNIMTYYELWDDYIGNENYIEEVIDCIVDSLDIEVIKNE